MTSLECFSCLKMFSFKSTYMQYHISYLLILFYLPEYNYCVQVIIAMLFIPTVQSSTWEGLGYMYIHITPSSCLLTHAYC